MQNSSLELVSGAYTSDLWESLEDVLVHEDNPSHVYGVLKTLHDSGNDKAAFSFVRILYDVAGLTLPDAVENISDSDETISAYITELLTDIENIV